MTAGVIRRYRKYLLKNLRVRVPASCTPCCWPSALLRIRDTRVDALLVARVMQRRRNPGDDIFEAFVDRRHARVASTMLRMYERRVVRLMTFSASTDP